MFWRRQQLAAAAATQTYDARFGALCRRVTDLQTACELATLKNESHGRTIARLSRRLGAVRRRHRALRQHLDTLRAFVLRLLEVHENRTTEEARLIVDGVLVNSRK